MADGVKNKTTMRAAFVMEKALGHATHYKNFREVTEQQSAVDPVWLPIEFEAQGLERALPLVRSNWSVRSSWRARRALAAVLKRAPVDAILFHTQTASLFSVGLMRRIPSLISLDATPLNYDSLASQYAHRAAGNGFLDRQKYQLNKKAFQAAARLVAWSDWARRSLIEDYGVDPSRIRVIPPGALPMFFDIGKKRDADSQTLSRRVRLLFVGGDFARKGGPQLLELMRGPLGDTCDLDIVTQVDLAPARNVTVHRGVQANSRDLRELYAQADLFVFPTQADCLGVVVEEAAAAGLPVITTDIGGVPESVKPNETGLIVPADDSRALAEAITALTEDRQRRLRMGRAALALAVERFDAAQNNRAILDMLHALGEAPRPRQLVS